MRLVYNPYLNPVPGLRMVEWQVLDSSVVPVV